MIKHCLDALVYELHLLGFSLQEIKEGLFNPTKTEIPLLAYLGYPSNDYYMALAMAVRKGRNASDRCKEWAKKMLSRCLDNRGQFRPSIDLGEQGNELKSKEDDKLNL